MASLTLRGTCPVSQMNSLTVLGITDYRVVFRLDVQRPGALCWWIPALGRSEAGPDLFSLPQDHMNRALVPCPVRKLAAKPSSNRASY